jgi:site-specific DNA-cytosine methylase
MKHLDLFSGIGGFALAAERVWPDIEHTFCDNDPFCQEVLKKHWPNAQIYGDIRQLTADTDFERHLHGKPQKRPAKGRHKAQREPIPSPRPSNVQETYLLTGGFPCQPFSQAGQRRGEEDDCTDGTALHSGDGCDIIGVCNGDTTASVRDAGNARGQGKTADTADLVRRNTRRNGGQKISNENEQTTGLGIKRENTRYTDDMEGNVPVAERATLHSSQSTTSTEGETRNGESTTHRRGNSSSRTDIRKPINSSATTATTQSTTSEPALINGQRVFLLTGGFPCQPFSQAGKRKGVEDDRFFWPEMLRVIREFSPLWVIAENVRGLLTQGGGVVFERVCTDLEAAGYEVQPIIIPAVAVGAPHRRDRVWFVAHRNDAGSGAPASKTLAHGTQDSQERQHPQRRADGQNSDASDSRRKRRSERASESVEPKGKEPKWSHHRNSDWDANWLEVATRLCGVFNGLSSGLDKTMSDGIYSQYASTLNPISGQDLPCLWGLIQSEAFQWSAGRFDAVQNKDYLFTVLWQHAHRTDGQDDLPFESAEVQEAYVRNVWHTDETGCPPQGWRYNEQYEKEHRDALSSMSHEVALVAKEVWQAYLKDRNPRLKALGNAIVPQVAEEIFKAIKDYEI